MNDDPNAKLEDPDLCTTPWVFETGEDVEIEPADGVVVEVIRHPYRTVFALLPGCLDDRMALADLVEEAYDDVGRLMAAAPPMRDLLRRLWSALDAWWSRDARRMGPELRALQDEIGELLRGLPGGFEGPSHQDSAAQEPIAQEPIAAGGAPCPA